ncbi:MAG TPA: hypothetical protein VLD65_03335 [Anaerolineales bacterium]|nr:hypothetical protein [Anaerolineales bacterium]
MNKRLFATCITLLLVLLVTACKLPAATPPPTVTTQVPVEPTATTVNVIESTSTSVPPTPVVVTQTPAPPTATSVVPTATSVILTPLPPPPTPITPAIRIQFAAGGTSATVDGNLAAGQMQNYVLKAFASQEMNVKVSSPNGDVYLGVVGADGIALLNNTAQDTIFSGTLPATQDYYLSLTASGAAASYSLSVEIPPLAGGPTPNVTPVAGVFDPLTTYGNPTFDDPMNGENINDWINPSTGLLPDTKYIKLFEKDDKFYALAKIEGFITWYFTWHELGDFYLQSTFNSGKCTGQDAYGLIIRGPEHLAGVSFGYVVAFSCDGSLWVYRLDSANPYKATDLVSWTPSQYILVGENKENVMGIRAIGNTLTVFANGHQVAQVTDSKYKAGRYGLFMSPVLTKDYTYQVVHMLFWDLTP